jgi:CheY-like chemotaxis protein
MPHDIAQRIVLHEPDAELRNTYARWLSKAGYDVTFTADTLEAFEYGIRGECRIILIDIDSPQTSDRFFLELAKLSQDQRRKGFVVCALINQEANKKIIATIEFGVDFILIKPLADENLCAEIRGIRREIELSERSKKFISMREIDSFLEIARKLPRDDAIKLLAAVFNSMILAKTGKLMGDEIVQLMIDRTNEATDKSAGTMGLVGIKGRRVDLSKTFCAPGGKEVHTIVDAFRLYIINFLEFVKTLTSNILTDLPPKTPSP